MLKSLQIDNIAIIEHAFIEFSAGLNILTGETGAGKSIIIDSIHAVTGEKTSRELIRTGAENAFVSALFCDISDTVRQKAAAMGIENEADGTLLLQRKLYKDGKNACRINGMTVTLSMLKAMGSDLINIHGQRDSQALLDGEKHILFLDEYARNEMLLRDYSETYNRLTDLRREISSLTTDEATKLRRMEMLDYQINELRQADIKPGENTELRRRKAVIENSVKLKKALTQALSALMGNGENPGAVSLLNGASADIASVLHVTKELEPLVDSLNEAADTADDAAGVLEDVVRQLDAMEDDMEVIGERLDLLYRLSRKYGNTEEEMLAFLDKAEKEREAIAFSDERLGQLQKEEKALEPVLLQKAGRLTLCRKENGKKLSKAIEEELKFLDMKNARFTVDISPVSPHASGTDKVEFLITANPGEAPKPLGKVASGGELSRMMLAMKNVLQTKSGASTLVFDEIDTGVSGSAAGKIAVKLATLSESVQVLCITHSGQIAAYADEQKFLSKSVRDGKTYTDVKTLNLRERAEAIALMTFGENYSDAQLLSAEQLIADADARKKK